MHLNMLLDTLLTTVFLAEEEEYKDLHYHDFSPSNQIQVPVKCVQTHMITMYSIMYVMFQES